MDYPVSDASARLYNGKFTDGDPVNNIPPSKDSAAYQNMLFDELLNVINAGGQTPDHNQVNQLKLAIEQLIQDGMNNIRVLGQPFWHLGETPPDDAMVFAGQELSRDQYPDLWQALNQSSRNISFVTDAEWQAQRYGCWSTGDGNTTFRVPDLRSEFIRALDFGRGVNTSQLIGQWKQDEFKQHTHDLRSDNLVNGETTSSGWAVDSLSNRVGVDDESCLAEGGSETRPRNIAWLLCFWYR